MHPTKHDGVLLALLVLAGSAACAPETMASLRKEHNSKDGRVLKRPSKNKMANLAYKRGCDLEKRGLHADALPFFLQAESLDPGYIDAIFEAGNCYLHVEQVPEAIAQFDKIVKLEPNNSEVYRRRATALKGVDRWKEAYDDFSKSIKLTPDIANVYTSMAEVCEHLGKWQEAIDNYDKYLAIDPGYDRAFCQRALIFLRIKNYPKAIDDYSHVIKMNPQDDFAHKQRGDTYMLMKQYQKAADDYSEALRLDPVDPVAIFDARAKAYGKMGRVDLEQKDRKQAESMRRNANPDSSLRF
jgi:tetratricopeptide (TPR) repeat protein